MKMYFVYALNTFFSIFLISKAVSFLHEKYFNAGPISWTTTHNETRTKHFTIIHHRKWNVVAQQRKRVVIIWTMMRSGSNFLAQVLAHNPNTFSFVEPFHRFARIKQSAGMGFGEYVRPKNSTLKSIYLNFYLNILHCKFSKYPGLWKKSQWQFFWDDVFLMPLCYGRDAILRDCEELGVQDAFCKGATTLLHKIISIGLSSALEILEEPDLDVRILHLVRDPRGNIASRQKLNEFNIHRGMMPLASERLDARQTCSNMEEDLSVAEKIKQKYPNRYLLIRYEDMMAKGVSSIISWLEIDEPLKVTAAYNRHTIIPSEKDVKYNPFSTSTKSDQGWQRWRRNMSFEWVQDLQKQCSNVMSKLGYRHFQNLQDYQNLSQSPILDYLSNVT